ncbi:hypothetical protein [Pontibacter arcticus]|nr:hypothetical protein [Pontibacter arcticus]
MYSTPAPAAVAIGMGGKTLAPVIYSYTSILYRELTKYKPGRKFGSKLFY